MTMNDFLHALRSSAGPRPVVAGPAMPDWVQRGLMRSFGEDHVPAFRPVPAVRNNQKSKIKNRK